METFVAIIQLSILSLIVGFTAFIYYLRTGKRWVWGVPVAVMALGVLGITIWW